jgi:hypothetical protein
MNRLLALCIGLLLGTLATSAFADKPLPRPLPDSIGSNVGYKTVAEALASLKQMKGASFSVVRGWTIVTDEVHLTVWSFAPRSDPSYPSVVKRMVASSGSGSKVTMDVLCEAKKLSCDNLVREFSNGNSGGSAAPLEGK